MYRAEILQTNGEKKGMFARGTFFTLPEPGASFDFATDDGLLQTSTVAKVESHRDHVFLVTINSAYLLKIVTTPAEKAIYADPTATKAA